MKPFNDLSAFEDWQLATWLRFSPCIRDAAPLIVVEHVARLQYRFDTMVRFGRHYLAELTNIERLTLALHRMNTALLETGDAMSKFGAAVNEMRAAHPEWFDPQTGYLIDANG